MGRRRRVPVGHLNLPVRMSLPVWADATLVDMGEIVGDSGERQWAITRALGARRGELKLMVAVVAVVSIVLWTISNRSDSVAVEGHVELYAGVITPSGPDGCSGQGSYADLHEGQRILVHAGNLFTQAALGKGILSKDGGCLFAFSVRMPKGQGKYVVDPGHGAKRTFSESDLSQELVLTVVPNPPSSDTAPATWGEI
jgi:hypothetical protein